MYCIYFILNFKIRLKDFPKFNYDKENINMPIDIVEKILRISRIVSSLKSNILKYFSYR